LKHFLVEIDYLVPVESLGDAIRQHREFLQSGYDRGWILLSGPRVPATGGVLIARAPTLEALETYFRDDPYHVQGLAVHRFSEFNPVKRQGFIENWVVGEPDPK